MCDDAFLAGGSRTYGILEFATAGGATGGPFSWMASSGPYSQNITDLLFTFGIGAVGIGLAFGNAGATLGLGTWWRTVVDGKPLLY